MSQAVHTHHHEPHDGRHRRRHKLDVRSSKVYDNEDLDTFVPSSDAGDEIEDLNTHGLSPDALEDIASTKNPTKGFIHFHREFPSSRKCASPWHLLTSGHPERPTLYFDPFRSFVDPFVNNAEFKQTPVGMYKAKAAGVDDFDERPPWPGLKFADPSMSYNYSRQIPRPKEFTGLEQADVYVFPVSISVACTTCVSA